MYTAYEKRHTLSFQREPSAFHSHLSPMDLSPQDPTVLHLVHLKYLHVAVVTAVESVLPFGHTARVLFVTEANLPSGKVSQMV